MKNKKKSTNKKLSLNKEVVTMLNRTEQTKVIGGGTTGGVDTLEGGLTPSSNACARYR